MIEGDVDLVLNTFGLLQRLNHERRLTHGGLYFTGLETQKVPIDQKRTHKKFDSTKWTKMQSVAVYSYLVIHEGKCNERNNWKFPFYIHCLLNVDCIEVTCCKSK